MTKQNACRDIKYINTRQICVNKIFQTIVYGVFKAICSPWMINNYFKRTILKLQIKNLYSYVHFVFLVFIVLSSLFFPFFSMYFRNKSMHKNKLQLFPFLPFFVLILSYLCNIHLYYTLIFFYYTLLHTHIQTLFWGGSHLVALLLNGVLDNHLV